MAGSFHDIALHESENTVLPGERSKPAFSFWSDVRDDRRSCRGLGGDGCPNRAREFGRQIVAESVETASA